MFNNNNLYDNAIDPVRDLLGVNIIELKEEDFTLVEKGAKCKKFKYLTFNRQYSDRRKFTALQDSLTVSWKNLVPVIAAEVDGSFHLLDGQGRLACIYQILKGTGKTFPLRVYLDKSYESEEELLSAVVSVNNTATPWDIIDYLSARVAVETAENLGSDKGVYETLKDLIENDYADVAYKTAIDVLGEDKNSVLTDLKKEWKPRFKDGIKVLNKCREYPTEDLRTSNKVVKAVDYVSRNADDVDLETIFDNLTKQQLAEVMAGKAETAIGVLLDANDSDCFHKSRQILSSVKKVAFERAEGQCEGMIITKKGAKRCSKKNTLQFHHDLAHSNNGSNEEGNIRMLCAKCNNTAKANPVVFWDEYSNTDSPSDKELTLQQRITRAVSDYNEIEPLYFEWASGFLADKFPGKVYEEHKQIVSSFKKLVANDFQKWSSLCSEVEMVKIGKDATSHRYRDEAETKLAKIIAATVSLKTLKSKYGFK